MIPINFATTVDQMKINLSTNLLSYYLFHINPWVDVIVGCHMVQYLAKSLFGLLECMIIMASEIMSHSMNQIQIKMNIWLHRVIQFKKLLMKNPFPGLGPVNSENCWNQWKASTSSDRLLSWRFWSYYVNGRWILMIRVVKALYIQRMIHRWMLKLSHA